MTDDLGDIEALCDLVVQIHNLSRKIHRYESAEELLKGKADQALEITKRIRRHKSDPTTVDEKGQRV